jgi:hypothetical protein
MTKHHIIYKNGLHHSPRVKTGNSIKLLNEASKAVRKSAMIHEEFKANSDSKDFDTFFREHRSLLVRAIRKYPNQLNESELESFDRIVNKSRAVMKKAGVLREWRSVVSLKKPEDFLTVSTDSIMLEAYFGSNYQRTLNEAVTDAGISDEDLEGINASMKSQIDAIKALKAAYTGLDAPKKAQADAESKKQSEKTFQEELEDLRQEIAGIYGNLTSGESNIFSRAGKRVAGQFQQLLSQLTVGSMNEDIQLNEQWHMPNVGAALDPTAELHHQEAEAARGYVPNWMPQGARGVIDQGIVGATGDRGNAMQRAMGTGPQAPTLSSVMGAATGTPPAAPATPSGGGTGAAPVLPGGAPVAGGPGAASQELGYGDRAWNAIKSVGSSIKQHWAISAAVAAVLIATGAAGYKLTNRRKRIQALQTVLQKVGAASAVGAPPPTPGLEGLTARGSEDSADDAGDSGASLSSFDSLLRTKTGQRQILNKVMGRMKAADRLNIANQLSGGASRTTGAPSPGARPVGGTSTTSEAIYDSHRFAKLAGLLKD